jgi:hypothetical protein
MHEARVIANSYSGNTEQIDNLTERRLAAKIPNIAGRGRNRVSQRPFLRRPQYPNADAYSVESRGEISVVLGGPLLRGTVLGPGQ